MTDRKVFRCWLITCNHLSFGYHFLVLFEFEIAQRSGQGKASVDTAVLHPASTLTNPLHFLWKHWLVIQRQINGLSRQKHNNTWKWFSSNICSFQQFTCPFTHAMALESPAFTQYNFLSLIRQHTAVEPPISFLNSSSFSSASSMSRNAYASEHKTTIHNEGNTIVIRTKPTFFNASGVSVWYSGRLTMNLCRCFAAYFPILAPPWPS